MAMTENYVLTINDVIEICKDAEQGFKAQQMLSRILR